METAKTAARRCLRARGSQGVSKRAHTTYRLQLLQRRLAHAALLEIGARGADHLLDDLAVDVALSAAIVSASVVPSCQATAACRQPRDAPDVRPTGSSCLRRDRGGEDVESAQRGRRGAVRRFEGRCRRRRRGERVVAGSFAGLWAVLRDRPRRYHLRFLIRLCLLPLPSVLICYRVLRERFSSSA